MTKKLGFIDHYDSFSFNVIDWLKQGAVEIDYAAFDDVNGLERIRRLGIPLVISPGPKHPLDAGPTLAFLAKSLGKVPILGICLGHQLLATAAGGLVVRAKSPFHGVARRVDVLDEKDLFSRFPPTFKAASYNSLTVSPHADGFEVIACCEEGEVQAIRLKNLAAPAFGVQFHPESFMSEEADQLRSNWLSLAFGSLA